MQLASAQLSEHLQRGLKSLYTLHGDEPLLQQECADALRAHARQLGYTERTVHTVAGDAMAFKITTPLDLRLARAVLTR